MPATATKPTTHAWDSDEWLPAEARNLYFDLFTREELLSNLRLNGVDVTDNMLTHWVNSGILPRAARRGRKGVYPIFMTGLVRLVPLLRNAGMTVDEIRERIRSGFRSLAIETGGNEWGYIDPERQRRDSAETVGREDPELRMLLASLRDGLQEWAGIRDRVTGSTTMRIDITATDADGQRSSFVVETDPNPDEWTVHAKQVRRTNRIGLAGNGQN